MRIRITSDDLDIYNSFLEEAGNALDTMEDKILSYKGPEDLPLVDEIFRGLHSMKGVASFLQLTAIHKLSHRLENVFDAVRQGKETMGPAIVDFCLQRVDLLDSMVRDLSGKFAARQPGTDGVCELDLMDWDEAEDEAPARPVVPQSPDVGSRTDQGGVAGELRSAFLKEGIDLLEQLEQALLELEKDPVADEPMRQAFRQVHSLKGIAGFSGFPDLERIAHGLESLMESLRETAAPAGPEFFAIAFRCLDRFRAGISDISAGGQGGIEDAAGLSRDLERMLNSPAPGSPPLGRILVEEGRITGEELGRALELQKRPLGKILLDEGSLTQDALDKALVKQKAAAPVVRATVAEVRKDLRVDVGKLDTLLDLVGELVIASGIVGNHPDLKAGEHEGFDKAARHLGGLVSDLQKVVLGLRMVPVENVFKKMVRLVHDQSIKSGKKARLELRGEKTEVDKNIAELIADPLVHMIRNSIDHGIEAPDRRVEAGKAEEGIIILEAKQEGSDISIRLSDDGKGLDRDRILAKAVEKGLVKGNPAELKDDEVFQFIFAPGFSTAEQITSTSGRGVGMDVVKSNIDKLKGKILIDSRPGKGATIDIRLPLTLSIIDGMQVQVGEGHFILPLVSIKETLSPSMANVTHLGPGQDMYLLRGKVNPILRLDALYRIRASLEGGYEGGVFLLIESRESRYFLFVDRIVGMRQTVVKSLPHYVGNITGSSGCSILDNGEICLILDVEALAGAAGRNLGPPPSSAHGPMETAWKPAGLVEAPPAM